MAYVVVFIKLLYLCLVILVLLLLLMSFLIFSSSCPINVNCEFRIVGHKFTRSGWGFVSAKQSKVAGDEFLIKYSDNENVNLLTTTNANGGLMTIYNKITRMSRCFAFVTVNNSRSRCSSSSWLLSLAEENTARRNSYADPHTLGRKTLAEVKLETIDEVLREGGDADAVLPGGKHGPYWLVGRQGSLLALENTPAIPQSSTDELTAKITRDLESQMEAKVNRKVKENMTWFLKKLGEANPTLKFDIGDFCATFSSDQDESGTPITQTLGGATS
ncbi:hypothetical protein OROMI_004916 [Orobanche minor]